MTIYYFPLKENGREDNAVPITLLPDGTADTSQLPDKIRNHLISFGIPNEIKSEAVFPEAGRAFLEALLAATNQKMRFRTTPEKI